MDVPPLRPLSPIYTELIEKRYTPLPVAARLLERLYHATWYFLDPMKLTIGFKRFLEFRLCPMQPDLDGVQRDPKDLGNFVVFQPLVLAQHKDSAVAVREFFDIFPDTLVHFISDQLFLDRGFLFCHQNGPVTAFSSIFLR